MCCFCGERHFISAKEKYKRFPEVQGTTTSTRNGRRRSCMQTKRRFSKRLNHIDFSKCSATRNTRCRHSNQSRRIRRSKSVVKTTRQGKRRCYISTIRSTYRFNNKTTRD